MRVILFLSMIVFPYYSVYGQINENQNSAPTESEQLFDQVDTLQQQGKISEDQAQMLKEQEKTYGGVPEREVEYYEETAPQDMEKQHDFFMQDHPLQEEPMPRKQVE